MKKVLLASLVAFCLVATGSAVAWDIEVDIEVDDAFVDVTASTPIVPTPDGGYLFTTGAGVHGDGEIMIEGDGDNFEGVLITGVEGSGSLYANQGMIVVGCCPECEEGPCCEAPDYLYAAGSYATIDGEGTIFLAEGAHVDFYWDDTNGQILMTDGEGDFTAGMISALAVGDEDPVVHAMGASGTNVGFSAFGMQGMDADNCGEGGYFTAEMWFCDEGCPCEPCPDCNDCPPGCPCD